MNDFTSDHDGILAFGCGCNKGKLASGVNAQTATRRVTVYQVQKDGAMVEEFDNLAAARTKAVELGGQVKVASKVIG